MNDIIQFKAKLCANKPVVLTSAAVKTAAVAMVIRFKTASPEVLMIERAYNDNDPWSGHLALPGGRKESQDKNLQHTAIRETREETGLILNPSDYLGRLSDVDAGVAPLVIACFVYSCPREYQFSLDPVEVADAFWVPLSQLQTHREIRISRRIISGMEDVPAIRIPGKDQPLWGITLRFVRELRRLLVAH